MILLSIPIFIIGCLLKIYFSLLDVAINHAYPFQIVNCNNKLVDNEIEQTAIILREKFLSIQFIANFISFALILFPIFVFIQVMNLSYFALVILLSINLINIFILYLLPKYFIVNHIPSFFIKRLLPLIKTSEIAFFPFVVIFRIVSFVPKIFLSQKNTTIPLLSRGALQELINDAREENINTLEKKMLSRVLNLSEKRVAEVMIPLVKVDAISEQSNILLAKEMFTKKRHSRIPVFRERIDDVVGILFSFDTLYISKLNKYRVKSLMRPCKYVPESIPIDKALESMKKSQATMAVVVNEYGGSVGIITMEDILEQIVGNIDDEFDSDNLLYKKISDIEYVVNARIKLSHLKEIINIRFSENSWYETLGGFLMSSLGKIPKTGDSFKLDEWKFTIKSSTERSINDVIIYKTNDV